MKNLYLLLTILIPLNMQAQLGFQEHVIHDVSNSLFNDRSILVDIDNDGFMDVFSSFKWFKNIDGLGNFGNANSINLLGIGGIFSYDVKDVDNDGYLDVVITYYDDNIIVWHKNDGQGNFQNAQILVNVDRPRNLSLADLDGDGHLDILAAVGDNNQRVSWFKNDGEGNFGSEQIINQYLSNVHYVIAADIDGDGALDIFYLHLQAYDRLYWHKNLDGLGNFGNPNLIGASGTLRNISIKDMDGDGNLDILTIDFTSQYNSKIAWYRNINGQGNFGTQQSIVVYPTQQNGAVDARAFDVNGNGYLDLVIEKSVPNTPNRILVWHENLGGQNNFGTEQFIHIEEEGGGFTEPSFDFGDVNGDGHKDLLWSSYSNINWFESLNGEGDFGEKKIINRDFGTPSSVSITNINNNLDNDLVISFENKVVVFENDNNNNFNVKQVIEKGNKVFTSDIDGDGFEDLIIGEKLVNSHNLFWYKNDGQGTFENGVIVSEGTNSDYIKTLYALDINNNGNNDILAVFSNINNSSYYRIVWFENIDGLGNFMSEQLILEGTNQLSTIYPADINGDGNLDIVTASTNFGTGWLENDGQGSFSSIQLINNNSANSIFAIDINGNGYIDVLSTNSSTNGSIRLHKNINGLGNFDTPQIIDFDLNLPSFVYATDLNNNGYMDIISTSPGKIVWYENLDGQDSFSTEKIISLSAQNSSVVISGELFGVGNTDLVSLSGNDKKVIIHENLGYLGNQIFGNIKLDLNANGCDPDDLPLESVMVVADNGTNSFATFTQANGDYIIQTNEGDFEISITSHLPEYFNIDPISHNYNFIGLGNSALANFCVTANQTVNDLNIVIYPLNDARPGFDAEYQIVYSNIGSTTLSNDIVFSYDNSKINFLSASQTVNSQTANTLTFNYLDLFPFEARTINVSFNVEAPPITEINDILTFETVINPISGDNTEDDNSYTFDQTVIGSYDPNDIQVLEGEEIYFEEVDDYLHYIIRFQNTGTADAINVIVENELDDNLDWNTLQLQTFSHDNRVEITDGYLVKFIFDNIHLPDSLSNEPASHGYITYKIKPKNTLGIGDFVNNTAAIFFDFNPPIITNTVTTTVVENLNTQEISFGSLKIYPNPTDDILFISSSIPITEVTIFNSIGQRIIDTIDKNGVRNLNVSTLASGIYFVRLKSESGSLIFKKIIKK